MKKTLKKALLALMAALLLVSVLAVAVADDPVTITMAMTAPWETFIPFNTTNANSDAVLELMFDKLIVVKANGEHEPRLRTAGAERPRADLPPQRECDLA